MSTQWAPITPSLTQTPPPGSAGSPTTGLTQFQAVSYTGTGAANVIALNFQPVFVVVFPTTYNAGNSSHWWCDRAQTWCVELRSNTQIDKAGHASQFPFAATGFDVNKAATAPVSLPANTNGTTYMLLAFG